LKPSKLTNNSFNVESCSACEDVSVDLCLPSASNSSINIIHGIFSVANLNNSLILEEPTPTYFS
jgi:hypothetical protein